MYCLNMILLVLAPVAMTQEPETGSPTKTLQRTPDVVYIPTPPDVVAAMLHLAQVRRDDVVYDLGCGDGRILTAAAEQYGCQAVGCDIDPLRIEAARQAIREKKLESQVRVKQQDLFQVDLRQATIVTLYLSPTYNRRLIPQLRQLPPGARIISHQFPIRGWAPDKVVRIKSRHDGKTHILYRWTTPVE